MTSSVLLDHTPARTRVGVAAHSTTSGRSPAADRRPGGPGIPGAPGRPRPALRTATSTFTVDDVQGESLRTAAKLRVRGVRAGDRVALKAQNSADYVMTLLALIHLDVSVVLLDDGQSLNECRRALAKARVTWLLADRHLVVEPGVHVVTLDEIADDEIFGDDAVEAHATELSTEAWFTRSDAMITWSSGSSGEPKGVVRSGRAFRAILDQTQERMQYRADDVLLPLVPFSHFYGLTLVLLWWTARCSLVVAPNARLDQALRLGAESGVTVLDATPASYHTIVSLLERRNELLAELRTVRMWCVGGAPLARPLAEAFVALVGLPLLDGYGSTEIGNVAMGSLEFPSGCGRAVDGVEVEIRTPDGRAAPRGKTGEIWVRSPGLMEGYLTADGSIQARPGSQAYCTEDLGYWNDKGSLVVVGRRKAVHRLGHTLYPDVIERKAEACGRAVKVVSVEEERRGAALVFFVEDPEGGQPQQWRRRFNALLATYERPNRVLVLSALPMLSNGKPDLAALQARARAAIPLVVARPAELVAAIAPDAALPDDAPTLPFDDRRHALRRVREFLRDQPEKVVEILTEISNHKSVELELEAAIHTLAGAEDEVRRYRPDRVPQVTVFMSSNVLLYSYVLYLLVPALFTERVAFRPSGQVRRQTLLLHELLAPVHQLPIEITPMSQSAFMRGPVAEASVVVFTGTYANAEEVRAQLHEDQLFLFFGQGINPFIVTPDANLELAAEDAIRIRLLNSGQDCFAPDAYFVPESDTERFVTALVDGLRRRQYGPNNDPAADYGPLAYDSALRTAMDYLSRSSEQIVHGGRIDFRDRHVEPTVVLRESVADMEITELFCPIFNVIPYRDADQLRTTISSPYFNERALGAMVYGDDTEIVELLARRHTVAVNETLLEADTGNAPIGGSGIMANYASYRRQRIAEPILISKAVADHYRASA